MDETNKKIEAMEKDISYFDKMIAGAERLIKPWKIALIACIIGWSITLLAFICFAYLAPAEYEYKYEQQQVEQSQTGSGGGKG